MSQREDRPRLRHMLDHAIEAVDMARGLTRTDLDRNRQLNLALVRLLEIVGEAAARVSRETRGRHADILWQIVQGDLPPLIDRLGKILASGSSHNG